MRRSTSARALPGRLRSLSAFHSESVLYGAFVWARWALNSPKRRFPARAVDRRALAPFFSKHGWRWLGASAGILGDGDCFYNCLRAAAEAWYREAHGGEELTVELLRGWVAEAATKDQLDAYRAMAATLDPTVRARPG